MNLLEAKKEIEILIQTIQEYSYAYYQEDTSKVSDYEFDQLLLRLQDLEEKFPELRDPNSPTQRVGGTITKAFETVLHKYPMLSLGNTYSEAELLAFDTRVRKGLEDAPFEYFCEQKFDGVSISLIYEKGVLVRAITRGDGEKGDNVTENVKTIHTVPLRLKDGDVPEYFEVRGEIFLSRKVFDMLNREKEEMGEPLLSNPRNSASGTLKLQNSSIAAKRKLDIYCYYLLGENIPAKTHEECIQLLKKWGFPLSPTSQKCSHIAEVITYIHEWETKRHSLPLDTDGIVLKINNLEHQRLLGFTSKSPKWAISFKYKAQSITTLLENITYQVGRTGAITPVAELKPVSLAGTIVKRASLHNANEMQRLDIRIGDTVFVEKGGEIIPKITGVQLENRKQDSLPIQYITHCPECNTPLVRYETEANHYCPNREKCPPQILGRMEHFISRNAMNIENLGTETIRGLIDKHIIQYPSDLYKLTYEMLNGLEIQTVSDKKGGNNIRSLREKSAENIIHSIQKSKQEPFENVLFAIGIRYVGKTTAEKLATHFQNIDALMNASYQDLISAPEIGEKIAQSIQHFFQNPQNITFIHALKTAGLHFQIKEKESNSPSNILENKTFVISGTFKRWEREELQNIIKQNGGKLLSSISKKLDYLVVGENMGPAKLEKAKELNITMITEEEFLTLLSQ
ncbi:MAG: NAD-dependent DNA ligase LigA [Chitinophagaceae bacterium]|nr:NAD-dependent DNA ligase LigA [Chitinophagaceae bacterium]